MAMSMKELLERLDGLWEKATNGKWDVHKHAHADGALWLSIGHDGRGPLTELCGDAVNDDPRYWHPVSQMKYLVTPDAEQQANADLIAALKNSYPQLRAALSQQEQMREALEGLDAAALRFVQLYKQSCKESVAVVDFDAARQAVHDARIAARRALALKEKT